MLSSLLNNLEFKVNSESFGDMDQIIKHITESFTKLDFVTEIYYRPLEDNIFNLILIHNKEERGDALELVFDKFMVLEDSFPTVDFKLLVQHVDDVMPDQLMETIQIRPKQQ